MNEEENVPFFINTKRRQTADSYYNIGRSQDKLRKFLLETRNSNAVAIPCTNLPENVSVGFYGVNRYISLEPDPGDDDPSDKDFIEIDEDVQFENTSAFSLFWLTFKRIAHSIGEHFSSSNLPRGSQSDIEGNQVQEPPNEELYRVLVDPSSRDPRISQSKIIYGDVNYLIQKFRMDLNCGSLDIALFSVEFPTSHGGNFEPNDLQTYVVSPECGSFVWIENGMASAIFMTRSSDDFFGNVMEWFRKILSDMTLADSVMIGHPFYWHAPVRRRLTKVMKYLKRLYRNLALKEKERNMISQSGVVKPDAISIICPEDISKIVINQQPSENLLHTSSTYEKLNIMLDQLVKKWFHYKRNLEQSFGHTIGAVTNAWAAENPHSLNRPINDGENVLESVTFLDFHPDERVQRSDLSHHETADLNDSIDENNNNLSTTDDETSCTTGPSIVSDATRSFHMEGCHRPQQGGSHSHVEECKIFECSRKSATSIEIEESAEDPTICSDNDST